jgi:cell division protein FtsX
VRVRGFLAAAQVAAGVVLLAVTLLFGQSIVKALRVDLGFDASRMAVVHLDASLFKDDRAAVSRAVFGVTEEIRTRPGIDAASWSTVAPLTRDVEEESFDIVGRVWPDRRPVVEVNAVGGDFFDASGIPFIAGDPRAARGRVTTPVVVVTESMARRFWPDESPVGAHMVVMDTDFEVVGVVASTRFHGFDSDPVPMAYGVLPGVPGPSVSLVVRGNEVESVLADVRGIARSVDSRLVVTEVVTGTGMVDGLLAPQRLGGAVALLFAVLALALSLTGVYGVVAYGVTARLREFGIRLTLGAEPGRVAGEVLRKNVTLLLVGVVGGVAAAFALTRVAAAYLFGVDVADLGPATVSGVVVLIMALIATWLPARRAGQVDPAAVMAAE